MNGAQASNPTEMESDRTAVGFKQRLSDSGKWILVAAFFFMPLNTLRPVEGVTYGDLFIVLALVVAALLVVTGARTLPRIPRWLLVGGGILLASLLIVQLFPPDNVSELEKSFRGNFSGTSLGTGFKMLSAMIVFPILVGIIIQRWSTIGLLVNAWLAGVVLSCFVAALDAYSGSHIQLFFTGNHDMVTGFLEYSEPSRYFGLTVHPNTLSLTAFLSYPLLIAKMTDPRRVITFFPLLILLAFGVLLSGSRVGLVGLALAVGLSLIFNPQVRRAVFAPDMRVRVTLIAGVIVSLILLFLVPIHSYTKDPTQRKGGAATIERSDPFSSSSKESNTLRWQYVEDSIDYIRDRPVPGYGFQWIQTSHSLYLQLLLAGGILALIGYLILMFGYLGTAFRLVGRVPDEVWGTAVALTISIFVYMFCGIVGNGILDRYLYLPVALVLAMSFLAGPLGPWDPRRKAA